MFPSRAFLLLMLGALMATACVNPVSEVERPCPCADGWTCCADAQLCVADAVQCERLRPPKPDVPSAPRQVGATSKVRALEITWQAPERTGERPITGYHVEVDPAEEGMEITVDGHTAQVTGLRNGVTYRYSVAARNAVGLGPATTLTASRLPDVPAAPEGLVVERGDGYARVTWERPPSDGDLGITGYVVFAHPGGGSATTSGPELTAVVEGLTNGQPTTFTVHALNPVGLGPASERSAPVVPAGRPGEPVSVAAVPGVRSVSVSWEAPTETGGLPLAGYLVKRLPNGASHWVGPTTTSMSFSDLENDTSYAFAVAATNELGAGREAHSPPVLTPATPGAPRKVEATPGVRSLAVRWERSLSDGRERILGYTVTASPSGVSVEVDPTADAATLEGVPSTKAQTVTVTARNAVGAGPAASAARPVRTRPAPVEVTRLEVPSEEGGCRSLNYELRQVDGERADVRVEVDSDGDGAFTRATQGGTSSHTGLVALETSAEGTSHFFRWNRSRDVPGIAEAAHVRITATVPGTPSATRTLPLPLDAATERCEVDLASSPVQRVPANPASTIDGMALGDFNRDGKPDLVVLHSGNPSVSFLHGRGNGGFEPPLSGDTTLWGDALTAADLDGDGVLDLLSVSPFTQGPTYVQVARGQGNGRFEAPVLSMALERSTSAEATPAVVRDLDGDGAPEVVVSGSSRLAVLRHAGAGGLSRAFTDSFVPSGTVVPGDFDKDGLEDLMVVGDSLHGLYGRGLLAFTKEHLGTLGGQVPSAVSADFNGDGHLDLVALVVGTDESALQLLPGDGTGRFTAPVRLHHHTWHSFGDLAWLTAGDLDGDGSQDVAYVNADRDVVTLLVGRGDGTFEPRELPAGRYPIRVAAADFDGSGGLDLAVLSMNQDVRVLRDLEVPTRPVIGIAFVTADFDGDGHDDVASLVNQALQTHLTRAEGGFVAPAATAVRPGTFLLRAGRFDAGPTVDLLALANTGGTSAVHSLVLMRGNGDGTFAAGEELPTGGPPTDVAAGDVDGDGDLDVVCTTLRKDGGFTSYEVRLLRGGGDGTFATGGVLATHSSVDGLSLGDLNTDGRADLVVLRNVSPDFELSFFEGKADGTLAKVREYSPSGPNCGASELLLADLNRDGHVDITASCGGGKAGVLPMWGSSNFWFWERYLYATPGGTQGIAARDLDGDGLPELLVTSPERQAVCVLPSRTFTDFGPAACFGTLPSAFDLSLLDVEHDGVPELLVGGPFGGSTLLRLK
jgi:hypothetical protein